MVKDFLKPRHVMMPASNGNYYKKVISSPSELISYHETCSSIFLKNKAPYLAVKHLEYSIGILTIEIINRHA
jgi:hypothetical protein